MGSKNLIQSVRMVICQTRIKPDVGLNVLFLKYSLEVFYRLILIFCFLFRRCNKRKLIVKKKALKK